MNSPIKSLLGDDRFTTFPIVRKDLFLWYEQAARSYWTVEEISVSTDIIHYETKLTRDEKHFVKHILAFFAASDGLVNLNLTDRFREEVNILEVNYFWDFQRMIENTHAHTYSILLDAIIPSKEEREFLLNAIKNLPIIEEMSQYILSCVKSQASFAERLLRMACVEGIFFTGCFSAIYWLQNKGLMPGLGHSNELIARDEALHTLFAINLYTLIKDELKLSKEKIYEIFKEAVNLAKKFINISLPSGLSEMNSQLMGDYIENQADNLITLLELPLLYNTKHNLPWMMQINLINRTNFFDRRVSEYSKAEKTNDDGLIDDDF